MVFLGSSRRFPHAQGMFAETFATHERQCVAVPAGTPARVAALAEPLSVVLHALGHAGPLLGRRVLVRSCMRPQGFGSMETLWMGSDFDGAFAEYVKVPAAEVFEVRCDWSDAELASIPCAYATAENMLHRSRAAAGEHVLVTGASGGVGSAAVQLAKRRGARVTAIAAASKSEAVRALGAERVIDRDHDAVALLGEESVDLVVDIVAGPHFGAMLKLLRRGGRYASSGAIGGPLVELDMRSAYLKDLTLLGCTAWDEPGQLLRVHAGLEDIADLVADLDAGFERLNAAARAAA